jgi:hypothetical protein
MVCGENKHAKLLELTPRSECCNLYEVDFRP